MRIEEFPFELSVPPSVNFAVLELLAQLKKLMISDGIYVQYNYSTYSCVWVCCVVS